MRSYGVPQLLDLVSDGGNSVSLTPAATVQQAQFLVSAPRAGVGESWPLCTNIIARCRTTVDQPASGGTALDWDLLFNIMDSFDVNSPILGNTHPRDTFTGMITKHIAEFISAGYRYGDGGRIQIAATDGDTTVDLYYTIPFEHGCFDRPHHFAVWLGWLKDTKITAYLAPSTTIATYSTGAVIKAPTSVTMWAEYIVSDELIMPTINQFHLYETPASGGTTAILQGLGTANGLNDVLDGSRILALLELTSLYGMGGATTADIYTSVAIPQWSQDVTVNVDGFFRAFKVAMGGRGGPIGNAVGVAAVDRSGNPNAQGSTTTMNNLLNSSAALYIPWKAPGRDSMLTKALKFFGDLKVQRTFSSTPSSGKFRFVTNEARELGVAKKRELVAKTGRSGQLERIWGAGTKGTADNGRHPRRGACLPERVVFT